MLARLLGGAVVAVAVVAVAMSAGRDGGHRVTLYVDEAATMHPGVPVRVAGQQVGAIDSAEPTRDGRARIDLRIDDRAWPLATDTTFKLRFGGTVSSSNRYIEVDPGRASTTLADDAVIARSKTSIPLEVDELARAFSQPVRRDLRTLLHRGAIALMTAKPPLQRSLADAPGAVTQARAVADALGTDTGALDTLVRTGDRVTAAIDAANPTLGELVEHSNATFAAAAGESAALRGTLASTPSLLVSARTTLARADHTLTTTTDLARRLRPAVDEVDRIARPLAVLLRTVQSTGPDATRALASLRRATPDLGPLLARVRAVSPKTRDLLGELADQLACIRPYAPEIAGFFSTWSSAAGQGDGKDKYGRVALQTYPFHTGIPLTTPQVQKLYPPVVTEYAFPRPPGRNAGQPWFLPECGVGPDSVDPSKDPEARPFDPLSKNLVAFPPSTRGTP